MNNISIEAAESLIAAIKESLPGYKALNARIRKKVENTGFVTTIGGRKNPVAKDKAYVGMSGLIQGSAADVMKAGLAAASDALAPLGARPILVVHDEIVTEAPIDRAEECLAVQNAAMEAAFDIDPPLVASGSIADNYMEA